MAFKFSWGNFDDAVLAMARKELNQALNKGKKPSVIVGDINVKNLHLGTQVRLPPWTGNDGRIGLTRVRRRSFNSWPSYSRQTWK